MAGLDPAIQESAKNLDARIKSGHDKGAKVASGGNIRLIDYTSFQ